MLQKSVSAICITAFLAGCATPHVVESVKTTDNTLSCTQIDAEMRDADRFRADAQKEKGMTGTNVAAVLFFWPAMIGTYSNANDAISAANSRKTNLMSIYNQKKCGDQNIQTTAGTSNQRKLEEIKEMLDKKLITDSEYDDKRKKILAEL